MTDIKKAPQLQDANKESIRGKVTENSTNLLNGNSKKHVVKFKMDDFTNEPRTVDPTILNGVHDTNTSIQPTESEVVTTLEDYDCLRITKERNIPHPQPTVTIDGAAIAAPGNITCISAQIKAGKTAINGVIIAAAVSDNGEADGFPSIKCTNPVGKAVIGIDSEQKQSRFTG